MKKYLMLSAAMSAIVVSVPALAQTTAPAESASTTATPAPAAASDEIVVVGMRASLRDALAMKREATGVVEVVSSKDIGVLPDVTIAETLNQIPGVNATRDRGNESQAAVSGLGPRLALGLIDGREMASSEPDRNVRWEIFPSEVVSGVEVYKTSQADLITGGVSGTIDIQTIRPLDYKGPELTLRGGPVYYTGGSAYPDQKDLGDRFSGALVEKITPQLGVVVAATYQDQKNGYEDVQGGGWNYGPGNAPGPIVAGGPTVATPWGASYEGKAIDTQRGAISSSLQWKPSSNFEGRLDALYSVENIDEHDQGAWISGWGNWAGSHVGDYSNNVIQNGALVASDVSANAYSSINSEIAQYRQDMTLVATGANGKWNLDDWQVVGDVAYSQAERASLWQSVVFQNQAGAMSYDYTATAPSVTAQTNAWQAAQEGKLLLEGWNGQASHLLDTLKSEKIDVLHDIDKSILTELKAGIRVTEREKDDAGAGGAGGTGNNQAVNNLPSPTPLNYALWSAVPSSWFTPFNYKTLTAPTMITGNYDAIMNAIYGSAGAAEANPNMWDTPFTSHVKETVADGYVMADYDTSLAGKGLTGNFGFHVTHVDTNSEAPSNGAEFSEGNDYTKVLPSFNAKWDLENGNYLRFGLAQVLSRPALNDLRADRELTLNTSNGFYSGGGGNPKLKPYEADAVDLSYENYFRKDGLIAIHPYYKLISNYIGYNTQTVELPGIVGPVTYTAPYNATKDGNLEGLELTFQTPFFFVPHLENFGIYSNASIVRSNIHENSPAGHPFPMNGVSKETATLDLYYSDANFESRIGLKYHSTFTILYTWSSAGLSAIEPETTLDYSASYKVSKNVSVRFQAGNLLNTPLKTYDYNNPSLIDRNDFYGRRFLFDITYKY